MRLMHYSFFLLCLMAALSSQAQNKEFEIWLKNNNVDISFRLNQYDYSNYNKLIDSWPLDNNQLIKSSKASFKVDYKIIDRQSEDSFEIAVNFECIEGNIEEASVSVDLNFNKWSEENYVLMPGLVYDGNRPFQLFKSPNWYPFITDTRYIGPEKAPYVADIPRLTNNGGVSRIQARSGAMTTPGIGFQDPKSKRGCLLLTHQNTQLGDNGISIEENRERSQAKITLTAPVVRETYRYDFMRNDSPSDDKSANLKKGDKITLQFRIYFFDAPEIQSLYDKYVEERKVLNIDDRTLETTYPFSNTFEVLEKKFTKYQWKEDLGFFKFRYNEDSSQYVRMNSIYTYALLVDGSEVTKERVSRSIDWFLKNGISPSGYVWHKERYGTEFTGIHPGLPIGDSVTHVRRSADAIYYFIRHFDYMKHHNMKVKSAWEEAIQKIASALMKTWIDFGQLGQFVSLHTGDVIVGNSTGGAIAPAALILASRYFENEKMKEVALEMGEQFYQKYTVKGLTHGGPGDILNSPDCEASYGLVESFTLLYEATGDKKWLTYAEEAAKQFSTWVLSYNFEFPATSYMGKLGIKPMGAVFASPQNGTGTPAICTYSGTALLNLTRYTGNAFYANLLLDIAHHIPQYISHPDRMINPEHVGWMSERVITSNWIDPIGEFGKYGLHTTWPEAALALTYAELPGVYINPSNESLIVFDNVNAEIKSVGKRGTKVKFKNPTKYEAHIKVLVDKEASRKHSVGALSDYQVVKLLPNEEKEIWVK